MGNSVAGEVFMPSSKKRKKNKIRRPKPERLNCLEQRVNYLEERFSQVEHLALWDSSTGEVISIADWMDQGSRD